MTLPVTDYHTWRSRTSGAIYGRLVALLDEWADDDDPLPQLRGVKPVSGVIWGLASRSTRASEHIGAVPG
jgi:hypothetical protein